MLGTLIVLETLTALVLTSLGLSIYNTLQLKQLLKTTEIAKRGYMRGELKRVSAYNVEVTGGDYPRVDSEKLQFPGKTSPGFTKPSESKIPTREGNEEIDKELATL